MKTNDRLQKVADDFFETVKETAEKHGWLNPKASDYHYLMMIVTEIAEAIQADRANRYADLKNFNTVCKHIDETSFVFPEDLDKERESFRTAYEKYIENSVDSELADFVIRVLSFFALRNLKLGKVPNLDTNAKAKSMSYFEEASFTEAAFDLTCFIAKHYGGLYNENYIAMDLTRAVAFVFEWADSLGIDLLLHIKLKVKYNKTRPFKHGKKY